MGELRQEFLTQTIANLKSLQKEFLAEPDAKISESFLRLFFRHLHTIKGTGKTFAINHLSHLAHEIENLVQAIQTGHLSQTTEINKACSESIIQLLQIAEQEFQDKTSHFPLDFIKHLHNIVPQEILIKDSHNISFDPQMIAKLSQSERKSLNQEIKKGKSFYLLQCAFALQNFYRDFKNFKESLNQNGEVIAVSPESEKNSAENVHFQFFFVTNLENSSVEKILESQKCEVIFSYSSAESEIKTNIAEVVENLIKHCQGTARSLNKEINFESDYREDLKLSASLLLLLSEIANHLLNNAVDHGIESAEKRKQLGKDKIAKIRISFSNLADRYLFEVEDDGAGIDEEIIVAKAREKGLIENDKTLPSADILNLIFMPNFTTSPKVSQISGRGIGLDAVKGLVEKSGGTITVKSQKGTGSTFSVYLPQN